MERAINIPHRQKGYLSEDFKSNLRGEEGDFLKTPSYINPEVADKGSQKWGYVIATSTTDYESFRTPEGTTWNGSVKEAYYFLNMTDAVALFILHGMGHNSGISHAPGRAGGDYGFMDEGRNLAVLLSNHRGDVLALINETVSKYPSVIQKMQNRFKPLNNP